MKLAIVAGALLLAAQARATIAYDNPGGIPGGTYGSTTAGMQDLPLCSLGLNFTVNAPIVVTALGAFDNGLTANLAGADGSSGVTVGIYNDTTKLLVGSTVLFTASSFGTQNNGDAFKAISPLALTAGTTYTVVAFNDDDFNTQGNPNSGTIENTGGGRITFDTPPEYSYPVSSIVFPTFPDVVNGIGPSDRYDAGTFAFAPVPEPTTIISAALMLLPFGASTLRILRRKQVA